MGYLFSIGFSDLFQVIAKISKELDIVVWLRFFASSLEASMKFKDLVKRAPGPPFGGTLLFVLLLQKLFGQHK